MKDSKQLSEKRLIGKIRQSLKLVGQEAAYQALVLFYTLQSPNTPAWCKTVVLGSLGYFISLVDGIPDLTPILGYTDDVALMAATIATISAHISPEIEAKAKAKQEKLFGSTASEHPPQTAADKAKNTQTDHKTK